MKDTELKNKAVDWLVKKNNEYQTRPCRFTPKEIADEINGATHTALGRVASEVEKELEARGIKACYQRLGNKRYFELL